MDNQTEFVKAMPEEMPEPTYWPFMLAVSLMFLVWGLLTYWAISAAGAIGMAVSLRGWIKDMIYEREQGIGKQEKLPD